MLYRAGVSRVYSSKASDMRSLYVLDRKRISEISGSYMHIVRMDVMDSMHDFPLGLAPVSHLLNSLFIQGT